MTMARPLDLETFDMPSPTARLPEVLQAEVEELRLGAYEQGYAAGWDDALGAQNQDVAHLRAELGRNLTEMALSYRDARRHVLAALEPLLQDMINKILPQIAQESLGQMILQEIRPVTAALIDMPILVKTAPETRDLVERILHSETGLPLQVLAEPTLSAGQAYLRLGESESQVDLDGVVAAIATAVTGFFHHETEKETS